MNVAPYGPREADARRVDLNAFANQTTLQPPMADPWLSPQPFQTVLTGRAHEKQTGFGLGRETRE